MTQNNIVAKLETEVRRLTKIVTNNSAIEELVIRRAKDALAGLTKWSPPKTPRKDKRKVKNQETCVVHVSDTQIGKRTVSYDFKVAKQRMRMLADKTLKLVDSRRTSSKIEKCVILVGGDIVEGETIFSHQAWTVDGDLWDQAIKHAPTILSDFILDMASQFRHVHVVSVPGNHGRPAPKNASSSPRTNFDMIATHITRLMVSNVCKSERITWDIDHDSFYSVVPVETHGVLLVHGDQISGGGGIGGYPLTGLARKVAGWSASIPEQWDSVFLGHFHRPMAGVVQSKMFFANGTTESDNDFALEIIGESGKPCQRVVFFNKEHGPISDSLIWLD